mmetsp:Transcript_32634/g.44141  ORF Transcript_32634/g.44141 Transcript_32634/m.44141 type:complete len:106 (+) Transcript_32634:872-1189(+)|eukprot:CAMPEP_0176383398 /NCGR_PEP_ID=MMETSP0126-20121128/33479_1 /TAXON_ID=141414 ORGANISM="Strombidinopsis acuminatum, Strain SPMC142" /NCGR_SAMPLE_ID=MMETSP0126 /ASSEMBLY_ACC=CAM_ASM_000229 /LENGTH=105 /DNA_ID=CAMNT_0017748457 /DNA_START=2338 /DNA_END=2655 /DNA_ORIENTATION=+
MVMKISPEIKGQRQALLGIDSVIRAEFTREREQIEQFRSRVKGNLREENDKQKKKVQKLKKKYDRDGVNFVEDEDDMEKPGDTEIQDAEREKSSKYVAPPLRAHR